MKISHFERFENEILVDTDVCQEVISESDFDKFLLRNDLKNWELNYSDHTGNHQQQEGVMTLDEYFETDKEDIKIDLIAFLQSKKVSSNIFETLGMIFNPAF